MHSAENRSSTKPFSNWRGPIIVAALAVCLSGAVFAQSSQAEHTDHDAAASSETSGAVAGTVIVLPDGTRCLPAATDGLASGEAVEHLCSDGLPRGLVGGVLESAGQVSLEVVELTEQGEASGSRLAQFGVQRLVLANGAVCTPADQANVAGTERPVSYGCDDGTLVLGSVNRMVDDDPRSYHVDVASTDVDGAASGATRRVAVEIIDGQLPLTRVDWVLSSWGTGMAPPIEGAAPTLSFGQGIINGTTGCNSYFAPASILTEGGLELGPAGSTLMACEEELMAQETRFMAALDGVRGYEMIDGHLYLFGGAEVIRFEPVAE